MKSPAAANTKTDHQTVLHAAAKPSEDLTNSVHAGSVSA
jgi:hypothetical protein